MHANFNPRAPCGARRRCWFESRRRNHNFNPRAPCGARLRDIDSTISPTLISTHAPLAGRDGHYSRDGGIDNIFQPTRPLRGATASCACVMCIPHYFNPRAPCGARLYPNVDVLQQLRFQPTRPLRGATNYTVLHADHMTNFNPRAPCGARLYSTRRTFGASVFQPTRPLRGATSMTDAFT